MQSKLSVATQWVTSLQNAQHCGAALAPPQTRPVGLHVEQLGRRCGRVSLQEPSPSVHVADALTDGVKLI